MADIGQEVDKWDYSLCRFEVLLETMKRMETMFFFFGLFFFFLEMSKIGLLTLVAIRKCSFFANMNTILRDVCPPPVSVSLGKRYTWTWLQFWAAGTRTDTPQHRYVLAPLRPRPSLVKYAELGGAFISESSQVKEGRAGTQVSKVRYVHG